MSRGLSNDFGAAVQGRMRNLVESTLVPPLEPVLAPTPPLQAPPFSVLIGAPPSPIVSLVTLFGQIGYELYRTEIDGFLRDVTSEAPPPSPLGTFVDELMDLPRNEPTLGQRIRDWFDEVFPNRPADDGTPPPPVPQPGPETEPGIPPQPGGDGSQPPPSGDTDSPPDGDDTPAPPPPGSEDPPPAPPPEPPTDPSEVLTPGQVYLKIDLVPYHGGPPDFTDMQASLVQSYLGVEWLVSLHHTAQSAYARQYFAGTTPLFGNNPVQTSAWNTEAGGNQYSYAVGLIVDHSYDPGVMLETPPREKATDWPDELFGPDPTIPDYVWVSVNYAEIDAEVTPTSGDPGLILA